MDIYSRCYPETRFGGYSDVDGTVAFYGRVNALLSPSAIVLDVGCGRGKAATDPVVYRRNLCNLRGKALKVIGIDLDHAGAANPLVDEFRLLPSAESAWPVDTESIDLCYSYSVLEHIADPDLFFSELQRVLKPGGIVCIRTPNRYGYAGLLAKLIPNRWHTRVLACLRPGRLEEDVFPTVYRCNTLRSVRAALSQHGFDACVYGYAIPPSYLTRFPAAYAIKVWLNRICPGYLKDVIFAFGRKR